METLLEGHQPIKELGTFTLGLEDSEGDEEAWAGVASLPLGLDITIVLTQLQGMTHAAAPLSFPSF